MTTLDDQIRSLTEAFATDIAALVRKSALAAVQNVLGGGAPAPAAPRPAVPAKKPAPAPAPAKKAPLAKPVVKAAAPARKPAKPAPAAKPTTKKIVAPKRPLGAKRPPAELAALVEKLAGWINANPGQGAEAMSKALGLANSELTLPIKKLVAAKRIRFEGQKRATKYYSV
jgi:hypothetical protein